MHPENGMGHFQIKELLVGGDWACAHGNWGTLASIARDLASRLPPLEAAQALAVADCGCCCCGRDLDRATAAWARLAAGLRAQARVGSAT
jgi:hypothetical protein